MSEKKKKFIDNSVFFYNNLLFELDIILQHIDNLYELLLCLSAPYLKEFYFYSSFGYNKLTKKKFFI